MFAVNIVVDRGVDDIDNIPHGGAGVRYRPAGSNDDLAILFDRYFQITDEGSDAVLPNENGFQTTFGSDLLGPGGTMFIDDVFTTDLRDPAVTPVTTLIDESFDEEIEAFVLIAQDPMAARGLIERALEKITAAQQQISQGGFQAESRSSDALVELNKAKQLDQEALQAIDNGDKPAANDALIEASTAKARAELFLEGHNPQPGPFPDGLGGFDPGDPILADRFESGDVSAWSTGEPTDRRIGNGQCEPDATTLCLPWDGWFRATIDWKDFSNNTGPGKVLQSSDQSGIFYFFDPPTQS